MSVVFLTLGFNPAPNTHALIAGAGLAGKKVTVHRYNATTPVWLKGILQNEYGVKPESVEWYVAESLAERYRDEKQKEEAAWERKVMGKKFSYSLKKGCARKSLATLIEYQIQQRILDKRPDIESLFFPEALDL